METDELKITQRDSLKTKRGEISVVVFNKGTCILGFDNAGITLNVHISKDELYALGDAIQRIVATERRLSDAACAELFRRSGCVMDAGLPKARPWIITEEPVPNLKSLPDRMLELKATQNIIDAREEE